MYSENQSRQLYVVTANSDSKPTTAGNAQLVINGDEAYFLYKGPSDDGLQRSDLIKKCNVMSVSLSAATDLAHNNKKAVITFNPNLISSSSVTVGGDYILNVDIHSYVAMDYNTTLRKFGVAHVAANTSASDAYKAIAINLAKQFSREPSKLVNIGISTAATGASPKWVGDSGWGAATAAAIVIEEAEQPFRLGVTGQNFVDFTVFSSTVYNTTTGEDVVWGKIQFNGSNKYTDGTTSSSTITVSTQTNAPKVADMEYFYHKNRGDVYGYSEWPNNIDTKYLASATQSGGYSMVDIHFYYEGNSHNIGHSEKTITLVGSNVELAKLVGLYYTPASGNTAAVNATKLFKFLEGTGAKITHTTSWSNSTSA